MKSAAGSATPIGAPPPSMGKPAPPRPPLPPQPKWVAPQASGPTVDHAGSPLVSSTLLELGNAGQTVTVIPPNIAQQQVLVSMSELMCIRDTTRRAGLATNDAMLALVGPMRRMQAEQQVFTQANQVLDDLIKRHS